MSKPMETLVQKRPECVLWQHSPRSAVWVSPVHSSLQTFAKQTLWQCPVPSVAVIGQLHPERDVQTGCVESVKSAFALLARRLFSPPVGTG